MEPPPEDRSSNAVRVWMPLGAAAGAITFVIAFVIGLPQQQTIAATAFAAILVFSGFLFASFGRNRDKYQKYDSKK